jgi:protein-tyrosine phosphatase
MNQIKPYSLWIGTSADGRAFRELFDQGIRAIVQLAAEEAPIQAPRDFILFRIPLDDGNGNDSDVLSLAIRSVGQLNSKGLPTLVCCGAGMSRSPTVAAAALSLVEHRGLEDSLKTVTEHHAADVSPGLWEDVRKAVRELG